MPRQKVNYHLRVLEDHGLVELVEERRRGNFTERVLQASAASYVISPRTLGPMQPDPAAAPDRHSARWLLALGSRLVRDVGTLLTGARAARKPLATFAMDGEIRFTSATQRAAFTEDLSEAVAALVTKHHHGIETGESEGAGKLYRLVVAVHPAVPADAEPRDRANGPASASVPNPPEPATTEP
jgi:DNA-binding transcriptional ArsR family regulator